MNGTAAEQHTWSVGAIVDVSSFGEDGAGELFVVSRNGTVYRLASAN